MFMELERLGKVVAQFRQHFAMESEISGAPEHVASRGGLVEAVHCSV